MLLKITILWHFFSFPYCKPITGDILLLPSIQSSVFCLVFEKRTKLLVENQTFFGTYFNFTHTRCCSHIAPLGLCYVLSGTKGEFFAFVRTHTKNHLTVSVWLRMCVFVLVREKERTQKRKHETHRIREGVFAKKKKNNINHNLFTQIILLPVLFLYFYSFVLCTLCNMTSTKWSFKFPLKTIYCKNSM